MTQARITRVRLENYKSIKFCDVTLEPITVLVGENGSGKSNFLDALEFTRDALGLGLENAFRQRGNYNQVATKLFEENALFFSITIEFCTKNNHILVWTFKIGYYDEHKKSVALLAEKLTRNDVTEYAIEQGKLLENQINLVERNYLNQFALNTKNTSDFLEELSVFLLYSQFVSPIASQMREIKMTDFGNYILRDGLNTASILLKIAEDSNDLFEKIKRKLLLINIDLSDLEVKKIEGYDLIHFYSAKIKLAPQNVSDGTLRALAVLTSLYYCLHLQRHQTTTQYNYLIGLDEPENNLHPAALEIIVAAIRDVSVSVQVLLSTHSPVLLEQISINSGRETVLAVEMVQAETYIDQIDTASRQAIEKNLFHLGELLEMRQLEPKILVGKDR